MKITLSKDGKPRFSIAISHRIDRAWLVRFVLYRLLVYDDPPPRHQRRFIAEIRREVAEYGKYHIFDWDMEDTDWDIENTDRDIGDTDRKQAEITAAKRQAEMFVDTMFPGLR